ncbi:sciellin isoform X1 [Willisornis vidua]|uniref:Sciellin isoform X1 n=1 Tax=Willisornis vidua TaxID=1566151 RepID=A0ABQ9DHL5_9PASS|nr:sciellin isoform X1 [Willisornis vidua]
MPDYWCCAQSVAGRDSRQDIPLIRVVCADENYGRAVLNQYKSQDSLHSSSTNEKEDQRAVLGRYRSDTTLDRIPTRSDIDKVNETPTMNDNQNNRQSWMPPPVSSSKTTTQAVETKQTTSENSEVPTRAALSPEQVTPQKPKTVVDVHATARNQDLDNLSKVNPSSSTSDKEDEDLGDNTEVKSSDDQSKKRVTEKAYENPSRAPNSLPETNYSSDSKRKTSKSSYGSYEENISGNTIKTVYSTSDRSIIGKDICTYCRKPLGIDAKMILDALQICCHSTCFKCEVCKRPLEDLKAGDSIWIYRQTVHCEPCYSKVKEKWIY